MAELRAYLRECAHRLHTDLTPIAQAQLVIPKGAVQNLRQHFETKILSHQNEPVRHHIQRAFSHVDKLVREGRSYASQLRHIEALGLCNLPIQLIGFLHDHDNMYRAAIRSQRAADIAVMDPNIDVLERLQLQVAKLNTIYLLIIVQEMRSPPAWRMADAGDFERECRMITIELQQEIVRILTRLEVLFPTLNDNVQYENIGLDYNINDFGFTVVLPPSTDGKVPGPRLNEYDEKLRCCICLETYTTSHSAFLLSQCSHTVGKACLDKWLNSTSRNSNLCPHCRAPLCDRRSLRPITPDSLPEIQCLITRLQKAGDLLCAMSNVLGEAYGARMRKFCFDDAVRGLNEMLFLEGLGFVFLLTDGDIALGLARVDWGSARLGVQIF